MFADELRVHIDSVVPAGVTHVGFVAANVYGDFLITEPTGHPHGVSATFNKTKVKSGERHSETLSRCLREQIGEPPDGIFPIPVTWVTANSTGFYFAGMIRNEGQPIANQAVRTFWCNRDEAHRRIEQSKNHESQRRDLALLAAASQMCLSPYRRILLMVRELHQLGFERLRAPAYDYPLAWRCPIVPAYWTLRSHGGMFEDPFSQMERWFGEAACKHTYSSAGGQFPFEWSDVAFSPPRELALRFVRERREIACAGWGPDAEYARWLESALEATKPNGLYYAFAEYQEPTEYLYTHMTRVDRIPLPPPGSASKGELSEHAAGFVDEEAPSKESGD